MNKLLQYMIGAGNVSDKFLPQLTKAQKGFTALPMDLNKYDNIPNPSVVRSNAEKLMQFKKAQAAKAAAERQGTISQAAPKRSAASKAWAIATNPMTALSYKAKGLDIPENFERGSRNSLDMAVDMINPFGYANAAATIPSDILDGNIAGAGLKAATILPFISEFRGAAKGIIPKLNPWSYQNNLPQNVMYRGIGRAGMEDALQSGVFRANPNVEPIIENGFNMSKQFSKAYFSPKFNVADQYGQGFIAEVPRDAATWGNRYGRGKTWSQIAQQDIPVDQGRILQKDWLMGYKPVNTSTASSIATEGSKTPFLEKVGESMLRGIKKIKPGYAQRKLDQVDVGNNWTREWYSNPIIKERYDNWIEKGSDFTSADNALFQLNMNDVMKGSGLNDLPESLVKRFHGTIARDNLDKFLQTGKATKGVLDPLPPINSQPPVGRYSYSDNDALIDVLNSSIHKKGYTVPNTTVHENIHYVTRGDLGLTSNSKKFLQRPFNVDPNTGMPLKGTTADDIYLTKPTEVHARIGELRRSFGLRPEQQVDYPMLDRIIEAGKRGETTVRPEWFNLINNKSDLKWLFNNAPAIAAPVVAGAALSEQKYGGQPCYKCGGQKMQQGGPILDPRGQWAYPGQVTRIPSSNITMQGVFYPVYGVGSNGQQQMMYPGQEYNFGGASYVDEYPMMQGGGTAYVDSVLNANRNLDWVKRLYQKNGPNLQIPGLKGPSTHYMESGDGRVYPKVAMVKGKLTYLPAAGIDPFDYADSTKTYIQFPTDEQATWFGKNYKQGTGVLPKNASGGQHGGLDRWFAEKWVDVKSGKPCGRQEGEKRAYPACRPSKRVSSQTPKTSSEMSPAEKAKFKRTKTSSQRIPYNHKK